VVLASLLWVATVAGASTLTWGVISSAGARVGQPVVVVASPDADRPTSGAASATKAWSGKAGKVSASCAGESISLGSAVPSVGFWVKVYEDGPERLRLEFEETGPGDDDSSETRLVATCVSGSPVFLRG
jgi:hypothetical protein